jgi:hypothetical protein
LGERLALSQRSVRTPTAEIRQLSAHLFFEESVEPQV